MRKTFLRAGVAATFIGLTFSSARAATHCVDFDDLVVGTMYTTTFISQGVHIRLVPFYFAVGSPCAGATGFNFVRVDPSGLVPGGSPPNELQVNNVMAAFIMSDFFGGAPVNKVVLKYAELGGNVNLQINGNCFSLNNFTDLPNGIYGGVKYKATASKLKFKKKPNPIGDLRIGGQELWIDNVCATN